MKKIYLILPLLILLLIILITACNILMTPTEKADEAANEAVQQDAVTVDEAAETEIATETAPSVDMSAYVESHGFPVPHGTQAESEAVLPLDASEEDSGIKTDFKTESLSFLAVGDNLIHSSVYTDGNIAANGEGYKFDHMYENLAETIRNADLSFINQESPIAGDEFAYSSYPMFNTPSQMGDTLVNLGFDIISIANNHMLDKYEKGYMNHINFWSDKPVTLVGGYKDEADYNTIRVIEKNGISIAMLAYTYGTNGMSLPSDSKMVVPFIKDSEITRQIAMAKEKADLVFVSIHWGDENSFSPNSEQRRLAQLMADNGVDVILGHHSHTIQPIEWLDRPDGGKTLVAYSLSNFMSAQEYPRNMLAGMLTFNIEQIDDTECYITDVLFTPTVTYYNNSWRQFKLYFLKDYTQEIHNTARFSRFEPDYHYYYDKLKSTISSEFLPDYIK